MRLIPFAAAFLTTVALLTACDNEPDRDDCDIEAAAPAVAALALPGKTSGGSSGGSRSGSSSSSGSSGTSNSNGGSTGGTSGDSKPGKAAEPKPVKQEPAPAPKKGSSGGHSSHHDDCDDD
ncbi:hypothetical protein GCM10011583_11570 [Streptomyces camponoticapitis]|uniref:Lipoprotein n=1 Tax=Streptomyces camponoticapitis TaxID=1616125 RepID=A0ABQ2E0B7_9ACTN|nr:hypothetical protein [Streptomyces camponoticapitis]GGJ81819.1 hypothetical protein GCM10011583_11570 [Streptomyces camponoticapitis]